MAIRVTQHTMYNNMVGGMQKSLGAYMESVVQGSSQKRINRPSDDPAGTYRVLTTRVDMEQTAQYQENVDTAKGWLNLADQVLSTSVPTVITALKSLAEQAATGRTAEERAIIADQVRQYFGQLINLSNTEFEGKTIFSGHKYNGSAFEEGLAATSWDNEILDKDDPKYKNDPKLYEEDVQKTFNYLINQGQVEVVGASKSAIMVQFLKDGKISGDNPTLPPLRWSNDGGATWHDTTVDEDAAKLSYDNTSKKYTLQLGKDDDPGVYINIDRYKKDKDGKYLEDDAGNKVDNILSIKGGDASAGPGARNGTVLYLRPTGIYQGDDEDPPVDVSLMKSGDLKNDATRKDVKAFGDFGKNIIVRIDGQKVAVPGQENKYEYKDVDLSNGGDDSQEFYWSYSTDGGVNWVTGKAKTTGESPLRLPIPGGYVDFNANEPPIDDATLPAGMQAVVHPARADLDYEIMKDTFLDVNGIGKNIFGGYYEGKPALEGDNNLLEVVGAFIGYLEFNNQEGCQRTLAALAKAEQQVLDEATRIGGMENRLQMASDVLSYQKLDQQERLSYVEDIDLTELLTRLTRQQLTYQTVLQSSSMIMQLSLANYV